jgi:2-hydroxy-6-oxonona-2,4-dienedioate hydrolase
MYPHGVAGVTVRYVALPSGARVRVVESGPPDAPAAVLVHGWGGCVYSFAETIPALAHAGHRVVALDLPGHGLSDKPVGDGHYTIDALTNAILAVLKAANISRFSYVGHSMGGLLGLHLAVSGMPDLQRLVLISSAGLTRIVALYPVKVLSPKLIDRLTPACLTRPVLRGILRAAYGTPERPVERDIEEYWAQTQWDEFAWACRACLHQMDFSRLSATQLRRIRIPVLVMTAGHDRVVGDGAKRARLIPTARVVPFREGGHLVMQECAPRANTEILAFLSVLRGG